ncbi:hypothetical protein CRE_05138 [Caenorhabditis remanei]|uniref:Uncharacterized protein n=1 Tax=Caenorhabditis remanei TaxID=31234 RepID=E3N699_CAERE|nr:hypothetical protein CRE_05138 [Caenorhabditis remanei]
MAPGPPAPPPRTARQRIGTIQSYVTSFDKQLDKVIDGARLWQREQKIIRDQEASEGCQQHAVDRVLAPRIAESLQRMLQQVGELPVLLGNKVTKAKSEAFESGSDPEEVESLGLALVASYVPILKEKKVIIADLLTILTDYTVSYELNVSVPSSPEEILEEMERSFEESSLQEEEKELSPPLSSVSPTPSTSPPTHHITSPPTHPNHTPNTETSTHEEYSSAHPQPHHIPETSILSATGGNLHDQGNTRASEKISDTYFNSNFRNPKVQQLFDIPELHYPSTQHTEETLRTLTCQKISLNPALYPARCHPWTRNHSCLQHLFKIDEIDYPDIDFWYYRFSSGEYELEYDRSRDPKPLVFLDLNLDAVYLIFTELQPQYR